MNMRKLGILFLLALGKVSTPCHKNMQIEKLKAQMRKIGWLNLVIMYSDNISFHWIGIFKILNCKDKNQNRSVKAFK